MTPRYFGAAARKTTYEKEPSTEVENADLIRDYIKGLMSEQEDDEAALKPISDDELQQRLDHFQVSRVSCRIIWKTFCDASTIGQ